MSDSRQLPLFSDTPQKPEDITRYTPFKATIAFFVQFLRREGKSDHTIDAFSADLRLVGLCLGEDTPLNQLTTTKLYEFLDWLERGRGVPCSRKSYARRVTTLKVYFRWLHGIGAIRHDPAKAVVQRSGPAPLSYALSWAQIDAAIAFAQTLRWKGERDYRPELLFRLLADTGIKKSETIRLTLDEVDRLNPNRPLLFIRHKSRDVYKERRILLSPDWPELLDLYWQQYQPEKTIFDCTARNLEYILTDIGEGAKIPFKLSFEVMRWTCAVCDFRNGMEEQQIREKLGLSESSWYETSAKIKKLIERIEEQEAG